MTDAAIKAMIHLLDDSDQEVVSMVEQQIRTLGPSIIPVLESEWETESLNPILQSKIENLIHETCGKICGKCRCTCSRKHQ